MSSVSLPVLRAELAKMTYFLSYRIIRRKKAAISVKNEPNVLPKGRCSRINRRLRRKCNVFDLGRELHIPAIVG